MSAISAISAGITIARELLQYVKERCSLEWRIRTAGANHPQLITIR